MGTCEEKLSLALFSHAGLKTVKTNAESIDNTPTGINRDSNETIHQNDSSAAEMLYTA